VDLQPIRDLLNRRYRPEGSTHYDGCYGDHIDCAVHALLTEVTHLRAYVGVKEPLDRMGRGVKSLVDGGGG